jgi:hypothetical protein
MADVRLGASIAKIRSIVSSNLAWYSPVSSVVIDTFVAVWSVLLGLGLLSYSERLSPRRAWARPESDPSCMSPRRATVASLSAMVRLRTDPLASRPQDQGLVDLRVRSPAALGSCKLCTCAPISEGRAVWPVRRTVAGERDAFGRRQSVGDHDVRGGISWHQ